MLLTYIHHNRSCKFATQLAHSWKMHVLFPLWPRILQALCESATWHAERRTLKPCATSLLGRGATTGRRRQPSTTTRCPRAASYLRAKEAVAALAVARAPHLHWRAKEAVAASAARWLFLLLWPLAVIVLRLALLRLLRLPPPPPSSASSLRLLPPPPSPPCAAYSLLRLPSPTPPCSASVSSAS